MASSRDARLVYSTSTGRICPACGRAVRDCRCTARTATGPLPARIVAKLRVEKKGRGGKTVTVVDGLPHDDAFLKDLSQQLKRTCGTGGAAHDGAIELQGDLRDRVRVFLLDKGFIVKG